MAAPKAQAKPKQEIKAKPAPVWVWLIVGVIIGLFVAFLTYLATNKPNPQTATEQKPAPPKSSPPPPQKTVAPTQETREPRFTFYTDLENMKVEIPQEELERLKGGQSEKPVAAPSPIPQQNTNAPPQKNTQQTLQGPAYILQAGSFKSHREADQLKAKLAFMGVEANIQAVSVGNNDRWYRVRIGPFANQQHAKTTKQKLKQKNIPAIVLKLAQ